VIQVSSGRGVRGEVHLEAPVEQKAVTLVGAHAASDPVGRLEEDDLGAAFGQHLCACEAGQPGPDDDDFHKPGEFSVLAG
jgi:hypothetical protein